MTPARLCIALFLTALAGLGAPGSAMAHPLGNFTVNRLDVIRVSQDRVDVRWILDQAEIPTFQERGRPTSEILSAKREEALRGLELSVDGRSVDLQATSPGSIAKVPGQGGLETTRVELLLTAKVSDAREVVLRDETFDGRLGWRGMIVAGGEGTDTTSSLPAEEPTRRLRRYPTALLKSPADDREISLTVRPGDGSVTAPRSEGGGIVTTADRGAGGEDGFAGLFDDAAAGEGVLVLLLAAAFGWGALHALSPGHGKAMVAAYLVGARGTARHAVVLGVTVTITHTIGVFTLGAITLALSQYLLPEDLYPWLNLTAGLLVLLVGAAVLRARLRGVPEGHHHGAAGHTHTHEHPGEQHDHDHNHGGHHHDAQGHAGHTHATAEHAHAHGGHTHSHGPPDSLRPRTLLAAGASAGLIPCPSALVVLLGAVAQQEIALGMLLIVVFSLGLASTLTVLGLIVVQTRRVTSKWQPRGRTARLVTFVPALSALVIVVVGIVLTASAVPDVI